MSVHAAEKLMPGVKLVKKDSGAGYRKTHWHDVVYEGQYLGMVQFIGKSWTAYEAKSGDPHADATHPFETPGETTSTFWWKEDAVNALVRWHLLPPEEKGRWNTLRQRRSETKSLRDLVMQISAYHDRAERDVLSPHVVPEAQEKLKEATAHLKVAFKALWRAYDVSIPPEDMSKREHLDALTVGKMRTLDMSDEDGAAWMRAHRAPVEEKNDAS